MMTDKLKIRPEEKKLVIREQSISELIEAFYFSAICSERPAVLWQNPKNSEIMGVSGKLSRINSEDFATVSGFIFSPFLNEKKDSVLLINQELLINFREKKILNGDSSFFSQPAVCQKKWHLPTEIKNFPDYSKEQYCKLVESALERLNSGKVKKIVTSRTKNIPLASDFKPLKVFSDLCQKYPDAFVSLVAIPGVGTWLGASPEILLQIEQQKLKTMALAGTQTAVNNNQENVFWSQKEKEEQRYVSDYIEAVLQRTGLVDYQKTSPQTVQAGNVFHLQTSYSVNLTENKQITQFLKKIHPTPAVCGLPKNESLSFILEHELHNRDFYSGYLGFINLGGDTSLYVNLRCLQLLENTAVLYVGSGIIQESIPENEWQETELKAQTLLSVLKQ